MKKLLFLPFLLTYNLFASDMQSKEMSIQQMKEQNKEIVKLAASEMSKSLPYQINDLTTLLVVKANNTTLEYIYEIVTTPKSDKSIQEEDHSAMKKQVTKGTCKSSKRFLEADITITYIYKSKKSKKELFRFKIKQENCF